MNIRILAPPPPLNDPPRPLYILYSSAENRFLFQRCIMKDPYMFSCMQKRRFCRIHIYLKYTLNNYTFTKVTDYISKVCIITADQSYFFLSSFFSNLCVLHNNIRMAHMYWLKGIFLSDCTFFLECSQSSRSQKVFTSISRERSFFESRMKLLHVFTVVLVFLCLHCLTKVFYTYNVGY